MNVDVPKDGGAIVSFSGVAVAVAVIVAAGTPPDKAK